MAYFAEESEMLLEKLQAYVPTATPFHMPGHKRNTALSGYLSKLGADVDITEIDGFDDLHAPESILMESMRRAAGLWGSDEARYLVNGSTAGILSAIYALGTGGGKAVIARNAHKSVYHALEITGLSPVFVLPEYDEAHGAFLSVRPQSIDEALLKTPDARFVLITSPTYEGVISDIKRIAEIAHARGIPVIVDEAHGAHLDLGGKFAGGAVKAGADIVIQSVHKTLPGLTQTAIMHISGMLVNKADVWHALDIFETSSPSYLLMASLDGCTEFMKEKGRDTLTALHGALESFFKEAETLERIRVWRPEGAFLFDDMKILISGKRAGVSGKRIMEILREDFSIELEAAFCDYAVAMAGAGTTAEELGRLLSALRVMDGRFGLSENGKRYPCPAIPESVLDIRRALLCPFEFVPLDCAEGRISAEYAWAYPPGIPVFVPGEKIDVSSLSAWKNMVADGLKTVKTRSGDGMLAVLSENEYKSC